MNKWNWDDMPAKPLPVPTSIREFIRDAAKMSALKLAATCATLRRVRRGSAKCAICPVCRGKGELRVIA